METKAVNTKNIWPFVVLVVVFLIAMWIVGKARKQTVTLKDNGDGTMSGTITEGWFQKSETA